MYGVIRRYTFDPKANAEINRKVYEVFVPVLRKVPGFVAYYWLNTDDGGASLTLFQDKAGGEASIRAAAAFVEQHLASLVGTPEIIQGQVGRYAVHWASGEPPRSLEEPGDCGL